MPVGMQFCLLLLKMMDDIKPILTKIYSAHGQEIMVKGVAVIKLSVAGNQLEDEFVVTDDI